MPSFRSLPPPRFHSAWSGFFDQDVPGWVKNAYSPKESWKGKPFSRPDADFFFRGIEELSDLFTQDRGERGRPGVPAYFAHPRFRSGYLLYFLPLQTAKFSTAFGLHPKAIDAAIAHGRARGALRVADLGCGPGTASLALLMELASREKSKGMGGNSGPVDGLPPIELDWFDLDRKVMEDGEALVERMVERIPALKGRVTLRTHAVPWTKAPSLLQGETSLTLLGHVLNESVLKGGKGLLDQAWHALLSGARGGGVLLVEPAARKSSQLLSRLRDQWLEEELLAPEPGALWGPCLHAGICPLADGRDWCHFSVRAEIPGQWFKFFSKRLGSERQWVKFSYLWIAAKDARAEVSAPHTRRVVSDPMREGKRAVRAQLLLCEPERCARIMIPANLKVGRGDLWELAQNPRVERREGLRP